MLASAPLGNPSRSEALRIMVFHGVQNLPIIATRRLGFFAAHGLSVNVEIAPNSNEMRTGLATGRYQLVHGAVDNAVAMTESENEIVVILGGDNGFAELHTRPEIRSIQDLRGKKIVVDAPHTALALVLFKIFALNGLEGDDYYVNALGAGPRRLAGLQTDISRYRNSKSAFFHSCPTG